MKHLRLSVGKRLSILLLWKLAQKICSLENMKIIMGLHFELTKRRSSGHFRLRDESGILRTCRRWRYQLAAASYSPASAI